MDRYIIQGEPKLMQPKNFNFFFATNTTKNVLYVYGIKVFG